MSAAKHTLGPWRAGRGCVVADHPVPEMGGSDDIKYYGGHLVAESIAPRNIPVIAAAPELLAALQGVLRVADRATDEFDAARAAIAKATGEAS